MPRRHANIMTRKISVAALFLPVLLLLTACVIPIPIPIPENSAHYAARIEPPARYDHPYAGPVVERVVPEVEVHSLCMSMGSDAIGTACSWRSKGTCYIVLPSDARAPVATFRRHEIAHCNGWPADHPQS
jgi:hypothetical protein